MAEDTSIDPITVRLKGKLRGETVDYGRVELIPEFSAVRRAAKIWVQQGIKPEDTVIDRAPVLMWACAPQQIREAMTPEEFEGLLPMSAAIQGRQLMEMLNDPDATPQVAHPVESPVDKVNGLPAPPVQQAESSAGTG